MRLRFLFSAMILLGLLFAILSYVNADVVSVNAGGNNNIVVTPDRYLNSFFFKPLPPTPVTPTPTPTPTPGPTPGPITGPVIVVNPTEINLTMSVNTNIPQQISLENTGTASATLNISQTNLTGLVLLNTTTLTLAPGEKKNITATFVAPNQTGVFNGTINIGTGAGIIIIPVSLTIKRVHLLFDSRIVVLNKNGIVLQGSPLNTQVTIIPMGEKVRVDVTLKYLIINSNGTVVQNSSETKLVESLQNIDRDFDTGTLPAGNYVIELQLVYPGGVAPSSATFTVITKTRAQRLLGILLFFILILIILLVVLINIVLIIRIMKRMIAEKKWLKSRENAGLRRLNNANL